jgi:hypothetical protein
MSQNLPPSTHPIWLMSAEGVLLSVLVLGEIRKGSDRTREEDPKPALSSNSLRASSDAR